MNIKSQNVVKSEYLNRIGYKDALDRQINAQKRVKDSQDLFQGYLFLLEHNPVITNGRFGNNDNFVIPVEQIQKLGVEVFQSDRGGDLTYHGPGQLVSYPIIDLRAFNLGPKAYINNLEQVIINLLLDYGIKSERKEGYPGVWTKGQKISSIGVAVKNGITMHGSALNVNTDLDAFSMIVPCGISDVKVTSMEKILGAETEMLEVAKGFAEHFGKVFDADLEIKNGSEN